MEGLNSTINAFYAIRLGMPPSLNLFHCRFLKGVVMHSA